MAILAFSVLWWSICWMFWLYIFKKRGIYSLAKWKYAPTIFYWIILIWLI